MSLDLFAAEKKKAISWDRGQPVDAIDPGPWQSFFDAMDEMGSVMSSNSEQANQRDYVDGVIDQVRQATGETLQNPLNMSESPIRFLKQPTRAVAMQKFQSRLAELAKQRPELNLPGSIDIEGGGEQLGTERAALGHEQAHARVTTGSGVAAFAGQAARSMGDPVNIATNLITLPIAAPGKILKTMGIDFGIGSISQGLVTGLNYDYRRRIDPEFTLASAFEEVAAAGAGSAFLGGTTAALFKGAAWLAGGSPIPRRLKDSVAIVSRETAFAKPPAPIKTASTEQAHKLAMEVAQEQFDLNQPVAVPPAYAPDANLRTGRVIDADGVEVPVTYEVVEARDLITSHTDDLVPDPRFPSELQPRARERAASQEQINAIAADLKPELLGPAAKSDSGAPVIGPDNLVESGNGRVLAIRRAYSRESRQGARLSIDSTFKPKKTTPAVRIGGEIFVGDRHADALEKAIRQFGADSPEIRAFDDAANPLEHMGVVWGKGGSGVFKRGEFVGGISGDMGEGAVAAIRALPREPSGGQGEAYRAFLRGQGYDTDGMREPVLVARRVENMASDERARFVAASNRATVAKLSAGEQALADARLLDRDMLAKLSDGEVTGAGNREFIKRFFAELPPAERANLIDKGGQLSMDGARRIQGALLGRAYGDATLLGRALEDTDSNIKTLAGALTDASGKWAVMRDDVASGAIPSNMDVTPDLLEALRMVMKARDEGMALRDILNQQEMFGGASDTAKLIARNLFKNEDLTRPLSRAKVADFLKDYAGEASKNTTDARLFGEALQPADVLKTALERAGRMDLLDTIEQHLTPEAIENLQKAPELEDAVIREAERMMAQELTGQGPKVMVPDETGAERPLTEIMDELDEQIEAANRIDACVNGTETEAPAAKADPMTEVAEILKSPRKVTFDEDGNATLTFERGTA